MQAHQRALLLAALSVGLSVSLAQADQNNSATTTAGQTQTTATGTSFLTQDPESHWMASGFVGSNFARNADPASTEFGGSVGYLWKSRFGGEFDAGVTPNFELQNNFLGLGVTPMINSYMANAIGALPLGPDAQWLPFVSIGVGAISLRSEVTDPSSGNVFDTDATRFAGNFGAGLMGFLGNWGFKADVRYLRATGQYSSTSVTGTTPSGSTPVNGSGVTPAPGPAPGPGPTPAPGPSPFPYSTTSAIAGATTSATVGDDPRATAFARNVISGLAFWRANFGVALRW